MFELPSPLQRIENNITRDYGINLFIKRDDLIHPEISGNKWRKLKYNIQQAKAEQKNTLLTFGGAFSNHITAVASAGKHLNFNTIGIIRGEEYSPLNASLQFAQDCGMQLIYVSRDKYKTKIVDLEDLNLYQDELFIIPEGGANALGVKGCSELVDEIDIDFDCICCACGTGTTIAGIATQLASHQQAIGFPVLKNGHFLADEIRKMTTANVQLVTDYHFGGYAKTTQELIQFIKDFYKEQNILLDYVYTGKLLYGIMDLIKKNYFEKKSTVIAVHTGGVMNANVFKKQLV